MPRPKGYRISNFDYIHITIYIKPSEWDRITYLSEPTGKTVSNWLCDKAYNFEGEPKYEKVQNEKGIKKSLCVPVQKWETIKEKAEKLEMNISKYVIACGLSV